MMDAFYTGRPGSVYSRHLRGDSPNPQKTYNSPPPTAAQLCALNLFFGRVSAVNYKYITETLF